MGSQGPKASLSRLRRLRSDWADRYPAWSEPLLDAQVASSPRLSGIGMPSPILWSHPLKMQRIVLLSSLLWWELGTNSLITGPGEWLLFRRFTSKLSRSWSWYFWFCHAPAHLSFLLWTTTWQNQQSDCVPSVDSDQPGHPPSLIRVFAVRMKKSWVLSYPLSTQRRLWSDWADAQADLSLH